MSILKIKDANGTWQDIPAIKGKDGDVTLEQLKKITGELENLSTEDKSNLVNAINEIMETISNVSLSKVYDLFTTRSVSGTSSVRFNDIESNLKEIMNDNVGNTIIIVLREQYNNGTFAIIPMYYKSATGYNSVSNFCGILYKNGSNPSISIKHFTTTIQTSNGVFTNVIFNGVANGQNEIATTKYIDESLKNIIDDGHYFVNLTYTVSDTNEYNISQMQEALKYIKTRQVIIIVTIASTSTNLFPRVYCLNTDIPEDITTFSGKLEWYGEKTICSGHDTYQDGYYLMKTAPIIRVTIENGIVTKVAGTTGGNMTNQTAIKLPFLSTTTSITREYIPKNDYHPATKKYVDDAVSNAITTVLESEY